MQLSAISCQVWPCSHFREVSHDQSPVNSSRSTSSLRLPSVVDPEFWKGVQAATAQLTLVNNWAAAIICFSSNDCFENFYAYHQLGGGGGFKPLSPPLPPGTALILSNWTHPSTLKFLSCWAKFRMSMGEFWLKLGTFIERWLPWIVDVSGCLSPPYIIKLLSKHWLHGCSAC